MSETDLDNTKKKKKEIPQHNVKIHKIMHFFCHRLTLIRSEVSNI